MVDFSYLGLINYRMRVVNRIYEFCRSEIKMPTNGNIDQLSKRCFFVFFCFSFLCFNFLNFMTHVGSDVED